MTNLDRRRQLRDLYGFDFPNDLFQFWEFARRLRPLEPLLALAPLNMQLVGPFEVLAGRFDGRTPRYSLLLHWRYYADPPEFFTVLAGEEDGLHWGYFLDEPGEADGCVAGYFARDVYELSDDGDSLLELVRMQIEMTYGELETPTKVDNPEDVRNHRKMLDYLRRELMKYATGDWPEEGREYEEIHPPQSSRLARVVAATREGMGIVAPGDTYRPLSVKDKDLGKRLKKEKDPIGLVTEARQALREGYPATALKLGKDLWAIGGEQRMGYALELLDAAYEGLRRPVLREVLRTHRANRTLPSVDILENEDT